MKLLDFPVLARDRIYIPGVELSRFGVDEAELAAQSAGANLKRCLAACVARTEDLFENGEALLTMVDRSVALHLRLVVLGGRRVLEKIDRQGYDVLARRPTLGRADWARLVLRALLGHLRA